MSKNLELEASGWETCPPGEFQRALDRFALRERRKSLVQQAGVALGLFVLAAFAVQAGSAALSHPPASMAGGISCADVQALTTAGTSASADDAASAKIAAHVRECRHCRSIVPAQYARSKPRAVKVNDAELYGSDADSHCD